MRVPFRVSTALLVVFTVAISNLTAFAQAPVLHWTFDEASSGDTNALDSGQAPANDGLFLGGATRTANTPNNASLGAADLMVGTDAYLQATDTTGLETAAGLTAPHRHGLGQLPGRPCRQRSHRGVAGRGTANFDGFSFNVNAPASEPDDEYTADDFRLAMFIGGQDLFDFGQSTADVEDLGGEWIFVATTYDIFALETLFFYTGTVADEVTQLGDSFELLSGPIAATGVNFYAGKTDGADGANTSLEGFLDDLRVYDRALTLEELEAVRLENIEGGGFTPGDFDKDGVVDGNDFLLWQQGFPTASGATQAQGDANGDGAVDGDDFLIWQQNFGSSGGGSGGAAVPEPAALWLLFVAVAAILGSRRR